MAHSSYFVNKRISHASIGHRDGLERLPVRLAVRRGQFRENRPYWYWYVQLCQLDAISPAACSVVSGCRNSARFAGIRAASVAARPSLQASPVALRAMEDKPEDKRDGSMSLRSA